MDNLHQEFLSKINKENKTGCWNWIGWINGAGYGGLNKNGRTLRAHRYFYEYYKVKIPGGMVLDHLCRNRRCVNPEHLEVVTTKINVLRGVGLTAINSRKKKCIRGHDLTDENIRIIKRGKTEWRQCRECKRLLSKMWRNKATRIETVEEIIDMLNRLQKTTDDKMAQVTISLIVGLLKEKLSK